MQTKIIRCVALASAASAAHLGLLQPAAAQLVDSAACGKLTSLSGGWLLETVPVNGSPPGGQINPACAAIVSGGAAEFAGQVDSDSSVGDAFSGVTFTVNMNETQCTVHYFGSICFELSPSATFDFHVDGVHSTVPLS